MGIHCKFRNFHENFTFTNRVKRHICHVKKIMKGHDLPTSVNDRVILPFCEGFIFERSFKENKTLVKKSEFTVLTSK